MAVEEKEELGATIAGQSFNFKGSTTQFLVLVALLLPMSSLGVVLYYLAQHDSATKQRTDEGHALAKEFVTAVKEMAAAQREMTCFMATPADKREADYARADGFCKRMARMP